MNFCLDVYSLKTSMSVTRTTEAVRRPARTFPGRLSARAVKDYKLTPRMEYLASVSSWFVVLRRIGYRSPGLSDLPPTS